MSIEDELNGLAEDGVSILPSDLKGVEKKRWDTAVKMIADGKYPWEKRGMKIRLSNWLTENTSLTIKSKYLGEAITRAVTELRAGTNAKKNK